MPMCYLCEHYHHKENDRTCDAYPAGVPKEIYLSKVDHREPYKGDRNVQFEVKGGANPVVLDMFFTSMFGG